MRRIVSALTLAGACFACGGESEHARIELDILTLPCEGLEEDCTLRVKGSAIIYEAGELDENAETASQVVYGEVLLADDTLILLEMGTGPGDELRYREVKEGEVVFRPEIRSRLLRPPGLTKDGSFQAHWSFSFHAVVDPDDPNAPSRIVTNGTIVPVAPERVRTETRRVPSGQNGYDRSDPNDRVVVVVLDEVVHAGCDGEVEAPNPTPPGPSDPSPPDLSGSGCEGDTTSSAGGCDGGDTSGCEGDTAASAEGCDGGGGSSGCEGDVASDVGGCEGCVTAQKRRRRRVLSSVVRLLWPVLLAGGANRLIRRRQRVRRSNSGKSERAQR